MRYPKGQSGNPTGRPKGIVDRRLRFRKRLEAVGDDVLDAAIKQALSGDSALLKALLDRLVPVLRPEAAPVMLPVPVDADVGEIGAVVISEVAGGRLPPDSAQRLLQALAHWSQVDVLADLDARLLALEAADSDPPDFNS